MNTLLILVSSEVNLIILAILCSQAGWTGSGSGLDELISSNCINLHIIIANTWLQLLEQKLTCNSSGTRPGCMLFDEEYSFGTWRS